MIHEQLWLVHSESYFVQKLYTLHYRLTLTRENTGPKIRFRKSWRFKMWWGKLYSQHDCCNCSSIGANSVWNLVIHWNVNIFLNQNLNIDSSYCEKLVFFRWTQSVSFFFCLFFCFGGFKMEGCQWGISMWASIHRNGYLRYTQYGPMLELGPISFTLKLQNRGKFI